MMPVVPFELALGAALIFAALEVVTGSFVLLGFSIGCLAVSATEGLRGNFSFGRDALVFVVVGAIAIIVLRLAFARPGDTTISHGDVNDY
jgi:membrane protein implicated in regulation of membrane protease activity